MCLFGSHRPRVTCLLALLGTAAVPARAGDDLHALVERWRGGDTAAVADELATWSPSRARAAAREVGQRQRWPDSRVLAAALLYTEVERVGDDAVRPRLRRDWMLALAAFHSSRYDGRRARDQLDRAARGFRDDPEVLFAAGRVHEAIGGRPFSGLAEPVPTDLAEASRPDLLAAA